MNPGFWLSAFFLLSNTSIPKAADQCREGEYSVSGMFLKGHVFKTVEAYFPSDLECYMVCNQDIRCQSYNVIIDKHICELNNRTKEARPEDFLHDSRRFYMKRTSSRVPLGSIQELPARSCAEVKASEGKEFAEGKRWIYSGENAEQAIQAYCHDVWQQINNDPVCFGARDDQYGAFNVTKTGLVKAMMLVHRHGSIKCTLNDPSTFWSCSSVNFYANNTFMAIITNANREALLPSVENLKSVFCNEKHYYVLKGVNQGSPELVLGNLSRPLSLLKDQQLQIWYGQDWVNCTESNNSGASCVDIFAWYV
ncbi:PREDICTED: uncharacterized protein LOC107327486 [Acropora digitifera]|uniref:uncharacterized protein LOC107327486 n=1 Tax=Acropora digitifera TaxID=70779 RepID=UPI00077AE38B|nr:PREDICTED: uncharacterized protein LOC107327486 [Acropora digitifera]